jgi:anaerobic selenocysteine-containing dehydrogenase
MKEHGFWIDTEAKPVYLDRPKLRLKSEELADRGFSAIPGWMPVLEHEGVADDELILTTFKSNVQTHSRTQNCKWLTEIYHDNPAWINPKTAAERGINNGDTIRIESNVGEIITKALVTEGVHPKAIAVSHHGGHWAHGIYASGRKSHVHVSETDCELKWWDENGEHPNWVIPNRGDPISGSLCWNDAVVKVHKT